MRDRLHYTASVFLLAGALIAPVYSQVRVVNPQQALEAQATENISRFEPIHSAAMRGDVMTIQEELDKGVPVDLRIQGGIFAGATALMLAARDSDESTMRYLLDRGADPRAVDDRRISVLMWAASTEGTVAKMRTVLDKRVEVNLRSQDGATALHWAAGLGRDPEMVKTLIEAGALLDLADNRGRTPLMTAARVGNAGAVRYLLEAGADRTRRSPQGLNALHWAVEGRTANAQTIRLLVEAGMSYETPGADGSTPLLIAAMNAREEPVRALLELGARPDASNREGMTPLMAAALAPSPEIMKLLLDAGSDPNTRDSTGRTALHYAVQKNSGLVTSMLLRRGADPDITDNEGWKVMHLARTIATLDPIVRAGADLNAPCRAPQYRGWTPMMFATSTAIQVLVRRRVSAGADPSVSVDGVNAVRVAMSFEPSIGEPLLEILRAEIAERQRVKELEAAEERRRAREAYERSKQEGPQPN